MSKKSAAGAVDFSKAFEDEPQTDVIEGVEPRGLVVEAPSPAPVVAPSKSSKAQARRVMGRPGRDRSPTDVKLSLTVSEEDYWALREAMMKAKVKTIQEFVSDIVFREVANMRKGHAK